MTIYETTWLHLGASDSNEKRYAKCHRIMPFTHVYNIGCTWWVVCNDCSHKGQRWNYRSVQIVPKETQWLANWSSQRYCITSEGRFKPALTMPNLIQNHSLLQIQKNLKCISKKYCVDIFNECHIARHDSVVESKLRGRIV